MTPGTAAPAAPPLADLLKSLSGPEGWGALDPNSEKNVQARQETALRRYERARVIADVFSGTNGQAALELLREQTYLLSAWQPDALGLVNAIGFGIFREGQNSLVRWIESQIQIAAQGPGGDVQAPKPQRRIRR